MSTGGRLLVVDDKENFLKLFVKMFSPAHEVVTASDGLEALQKVVAQPFDVVLTDIRMPRADGFEVLRTVKQRWPETEVVMVTGHGSIASAVDAMRQGAYDYLEKPFDPDVAVLVVERALERKRLRLQTAALQRELEGLYGFDQLVGKSRAMQQVYGLLEQAASLDITVLLTGASGTGKELAARAIHYQGTRKEQRFVPVNCGALPQELVESELFGHAKGSFTGAQAAKPGLFEEAEGGTLFLDEIGELPLPVQVKLNRALQEREIRRVGETKATKVDVRVIAATHRDLKAEVQAGRFREDLYYRLNVFPLRLPNLRERAEDIPLLVTHFLAKFAKAYARAVTEVAPEAMALLTGYAWPGNVRELENVVERAVAITRGATLVPEALPEDLRGEQVGLLPGPVLARLPYGEALDLARDKVSHEYLVALMKEFVGNVTHAAERAGIERESLHRLLKRYGVKSETFKKEPGKA
jgi:two-component system response regulator HydG